MTVFIVVFIIFKGYRLKVPILKIRVPGNRLKIQAFYYYFKLFNVFTSFIGYN